MSKNSVADTMRRWIGKYRNLAYTPPTVERSKAIDNAEEILLAQANHMARLENMFWMTFQYWMTPNGPTDKEMYSAIADVHNAYDKGS